MNKWLCLSGFFDSIIHSLVFRKFSPFWKFLSFYLLFWTNVSSFLNDKKRTSAASKAPLPSTSQGYKENAKSGQVSLTPRFDSSSNLLLMCQDVTTDILTSFDWSGVEHSSFLIKQAKKKINSRFFWSVKIQCLVEGCIVFSFFLLLFPCERSFKVERHSKEERDDFVLESAEDLLELLKDFQ